MRTRKIRRIGAILSTALSRILIVFILDGQLLDRSRLLSRGLFDGRLLVGGLLGRGLWLHSLFLVVFGLLLGRLLGRGALLLGGSTLITIESGSLGTSLLASRLGLRGSGPVAVIRRGVGMFSEVVGLQQALVPLVTVKVLGEAGKREQGDILRSGLGDNVKVVGNLLKVGLVLRQR